MAVRWSQPKITSRRLGSGAASGRSHANANAIVSPVFEPSGSRLHSLLSEEWYSLVLPCVEGGKANPYYESHSYQYVKPVWEEGPCDKKYDWFNSNSTIAPGVEETLFGIH